MTAISEGAFAPTKPLLRTFAIFAATVFAIGVPIAQAMGAFGQNAEAFASEGDSTLKAAGYAFSIWSLIYLWLAAYAVYQALPKTPNSATLDQFGWPSVVALIGCGLWLIAAARDMQWATVAIIVVSALSVIVPFMKSRAGQSRGDAWVVEAPLAMLAGWLTIAASINTLTVMTAEGMIDDPMLWAGGGIVVVTVVAASVFLRARTPLYLAPIVWGLAAVAVAEFERKPEIAWLAIGASAVLAGLAFFRSRKTLRT